jgi:hypothetical protein
MRRNQVKRSNAAATVSTTLSACAALLGLAAAASAQSVPAGPLSIVTNENPAEPGAFTLDFGALGVVARSSITSTTYELSVDTVRRTARFVSYLQHVEPLILPGGFSTGDITVEIVDGSSAGTFDPFTRTFHTAETYAIHFTGDLSAFGLTSPVFLPSASSGDLIVDPVEGGVVSMDWDGVGQLSNPFDPSTPIEFTYRCAVNTVFAATPANMVGLALTPDVLSLELPKEIERSLVAVLDRSLAQIQRGKAPRAVNSLREFIEKVEVLSGGVIAAADAAELVAAASHTIDLIELDRLAGLPAGFRR